MAITEQKFSVVSDLLGDREDIANVKMPNAYMPESAGTFLQYGMLRTMPGANGYLSAIRVRPKNKAWFKSR